jgi:hypothetical protein
MARTTRTRIPVAAKLAPVVVVAGMALGWLLGSATDPVMKQRAASWPSAPPRLETAAITSNEGWPALGPDPGALYTSNGRPDLDYDAVVAAEWALPEAQAENDLAPLPRFDRAFEAAGAAEQAAQDVEEAMAAPAMEESQAEVGARKSALARSGLY